MITTIIDNHHDLRLEVQPRFGDIHSGSMTCILLVCLPFVLLSYAVEAGAYIGRGVVGRRTQPTPLSFFNAVSRSVIGHLQEVGPSPLMELTEDIMSFERYFARWLVRQGRFEEKITRPSAVDVATGDSTSVKVYTTPFEDMTVRRFAN